MDGTLSEHEFMMGINKWAQHVAEARKHSDQEAQTSSLDISGSPAFWAAKFDEAKAVSC